MRDIESEDEAEAQLESVEAALAQRLRSRSRLASSHSWTPWDNLAVDPAANRGGGGGAAAAARAAGKGGSAAGTQAQAQDADAQERVRRPRDKKGNSARDSLVRAVNAAVMERKREAAPAGAQQQGSASRGKGGVQLGRRPGWAGGGYGPTTRGMEQRQGAADAPAASEPQPQTNAAPGQPAGGSSSAWGHKRQQEGGAQSAGSRGKGNGGGGGGGASDESLLQMLRSSRSRRSAR